MLVDDADAAGIEGHRHKHSHQHQRGGDEGTNQLAHALHRCLAGAHATFEILGDRLDHHNRVIHHQTGGEHQAQQGELVDRKAKRLNKGECADQRNRNCQAGYHRSAPVLQEQKQDYQHQHNRQAQGVGHAVHGRLYELADVVDLRDRDPRRHRLGELVHHRHNCFRHIQSVALGGLENRHCDRGIAIETHRLLGEGVEAIGGLAHIPQPQQIALGRLTHYQVIELLDRHQVAVISHQNWIGKQLVTPGRRPTH